MRERRITIPELALIATTRGMLGIGIGLLSAERLRPHPRRTLGWTLLAIGAVSTIPLVLRQVIRKCEQLAASAVMG
jgi:hypothetical protein